MGRLVRDVNTPLLLVSPNRNPKTFRRHINKFIDWYTFDPKPTSSVEYAFYQLSIVVHVPPLRVCRVRAFQVELLERWFFIDRDFFGIFFPKHLYLSTHSPARCRREQKSRQISRSACLLQYSNCFSSYTNNDVRTLRVVDDCCDVRTTWKFIKKKKKNRKLFSDRFVLQETLLTTSNCYLRRLSFYFPTKFTVAVSII